MDRKFYVSDDYKGYYYGWVLSCAPHDLLNKMKSFNNNNNNNRNNSNNKSPTADNSLKNLMPNSRDKVKIRMQSKRRKKEN